jgi:hypothetical protein
MPIPLFRDQDCLDVQRSTSPVPARYPYLRVSGIFSDATSPIATIPATYQANQLMSC